MLSLVIGIFLIASPAIGSSITGNCDDKGLVLSNNRYNGLVIAINPEIQESSAIIDKLKNIWTDASKVLWAATKNRAYFGDIAILVPKTWKKFSYLDATAETYDKAHVIVANENPAFGNSPYTLQYGSCGEPGQYIHLTPQYVLDEDVVQDYGPKGKTMVHEWAHLRWGVFDENPTPGTDPFYFDSYENLQATRCPVSLKGRNVFVDENTNKYRDCQSSKETNWMPEDGCIFLPNKEQDEKLNASMLSHYYLNDVVAFCHDDESDPLNLHNREAPNNQNRLCDQRSVWSVMESSRDFNGVNFPNPKLSDIKPTFKVVRATIPRFVLVLDTSGSMSSGDRFSCMITAAISFVDIFATEGTAIGIITFSSSTSIVQNMIEIKSNNDKANLVKSIENIPQPNGGTCIGCGIDKAIDILKSSFGTFGAHVVVLTDGDETVSPYVEDVKDYAYSNGVIIDPIFFGQTKNQDLVDLSSNTCGQLMASTTECNLNLIEAFKGLSETNDGDNFNKVFQIYGESYTIAAGGFERGFVWVDSTIGKRTTFTITWSQYSSAPRVDITNPAGGKYCSVQSSSCLENIVTVDTSTKIIKFVIPGVAAVGAWFYEIQGSSHTQLINVLVTSMAANSSVEPIVVKSTLSPISVASGEPIVINAKVTQGYEPVIGATVEAAITNIADGQTSYLQLYDQGSAPDVRRFDGVYSRYFTRYSQAGKYSVKVIVTGTGNTTTSYLEGSSAAFIYGYIDSDGSVVLNPNIANRPNANKQTGTSASSLDPFRRIESAGGFSFSGQSNTPSTDNYPPSQVIDLAVRQSNPLDVTKGVSLTFTAPGDNYDDGTASSYVIRYSYHNSSILTKSFSSGILVSADQLLFGDLNSPSVANTIENFIVNLTDIPKNKDLVTVAFALQAIDDVGNAAKVSNVAMMNLFLKPPAIACSDEKGNPISGDPFEKPEDCTYFYQCSNGVLHTLECKNGTAFNPAVGTCDHPYNVKGCGGDVNPAPPTKTTESPSPAQPTCVDENGQLLTTPPFPKVNDCTKFYQCSNGFLFEFDCPAGLFFNPQHLYCDWPQNVPGC